MLPRPGCEEIFEARSSVSEDEGTKDVLPAAGRVFVRGSMGRRGVRRDIWRVDEGVDVWYVGAMRGLRSVDALVAGRAATLKHRKAFMICVGAAIASSLLDVPFSWWCGQIGRAHV